MRSPLAAVLLACVLAAPAGAGTLAQSATQPPVQGGLLLESGPLALFAAGLFVLALSQVLRRRS